MQADCNAKSNQAKDEAGKTKQDRWRERNKDKQNAMSKAWADRNPDKVSEYKERKQALRRAAIESLRQAPVECIRCGGKIEWPKKVCSVCKNTRRRELDQARAITPARLEKARRYKTKSRLLYRTDRITPEFLGWVYGCAYCGATGVKLELDHIVPPPLGKHHVSNVVFVCRSCNARKGAKPLSEFVR